MLDAPLTARAEEDRAWLVKKLGQRLGAPARDEDLWCIEVLRMNDKRCWYYGKTLEGVYGRIRAEAERALAAKRQARAAA